MMHATVSRRQFLQYTSLATVAAIAVACRPTLAPTIAPTQAPEATAAATVAPTEAPTAAPTAAEATAVPSKYGEAPMLAEMVKAGTLPPVEERLPKEPVVILVTEEIGQYGGIWHRVAVGPGDAGIINSRLSYECLFRWSVDGRGVVPNVAKGYGVSADAAEFTFYLREGMKWSDGKPFTADDFLFWYQDVLLNTDLTPSFPRWLRDPVNDEPMVLEKVDDYTFKIKFKSSYGLFIQMLAGPSALGLTDYPAHYLKQFHPNYVDKEELDKKTKDAGFDNWWEFFGNKHSWQNPEHPHV
ncbi:MAG: ABC transporter substrate-binding protein, partial [Anaerolineae bacterium]